MSQDEKIKDALISCEAWLTSWGSHVAYCRGYLNCTCGLDAVRHEASFALVGTEDLDEPRAALSAMPQRDELWIGDMMIRHAPNGIWIGRRGGEGGEFATEHVERVIAQFYRENF